MVGCTEESVSSLLATVTQSLHLQIHPPSISSLSLLHLHKIEGYRPASEWPLSSSLPESAHSTQIGARPGIFWRQFNDILGKMELQRCHGVSGNCRCNAALMPP